LGTGGIVIVRVATDILAELIQQRPVKVRLVLLKVGFSTLYRGYAIFLGLIKGYLVQAGKKTNRASSRLFRAAAAGEAKVSLSFSYESPRCCK
jgi:hypothetical protein